MKPILSLESELTPVERVRTSSRAFERLVDYARQRHESGADGWVVQHIAAHDQAERLAERCREVFGRDPVFVGEIGPVLSAHVGPGLLGIGSIPAAVPRIAPSAAGARIPAGHGQPGAPRGEGGRQDRPDRRRGRRSLLYLIYLVRKPIGWLLIATFLAVALSGPVNVLDRYMKRGFAIAIVYLGHARRSRSPSAR